MAYIGQTETKRQKTGTYRQTVRVQCTVRAQHVRAQHADIPLRAKVRSSSKNTQQAFLLERNSFSVVRNEHLSLDVNGFPSCTSSGEFSHCEIILGLAGLDAVNWSIPSHRARNSTPYSPNEC